MSDSELPFDKIGLVPDLRAHLSKGLCEAYDREIDAMTGKGPGRFSKANAESLKSGFRDGVLNAFNLLTSKLER